MCPQLTDFCVAQYDEESGGKDYSVIKYISFYRGKCIFDLIFELHI